MNTVKYKWDDIRYAYQVAKLGTLTAAANELNVYHSTVLRRVEALEKQLNTSLFHRHAKGYTPTESGLLLLKIAEQMEEDLNRLACKINGMDEQLTGTLAITSLGIFTPILIPVIAQFQQQHSEIKVEYSADSRNYRLERGEAHISIRHGIKPNLPDCIVQPLKPLPVSLYASRDYIKQFGHMENTADIQGHRFISTTTALHHVPFYAWIKNNIPNEQIELRVSETSDIQQAVCSGIGIAPLIDLLASVNPDLVPLFKAPDNWTANLWLVTHRDFHRTAKVQAFSQFLKDTI